MESTASDISMEKNEDQEMIGDPQNVPDTEQDAEDEVEVQDESEPIEEEKVVPRRSARKRTSVERSEFETDEVNPVSVTPGQGSELGSIEDFVTNFTTLRTPETTLKKFHRCLFKTDGKAPTRKKNVRAWSGVNAPQEVAEKSRMTNYFQKNCIIQEIHSIARLFGLKCVGQKGKIVDEIVDILLKPDASNISINSAAPGRRTTRTAKKQPRAATRTKTRRGKYEESDEGEEEMEKKLEELEESEKEADPSEEETRKVGRPAKRVQKAESKESTVKESEFKLETETSESVVQKEEENVDVEMVSSEDVSQKIVTETEIPKMTEFTEESSTQSKADAAEVSEGPDANKSDTSAICAESKAEPSVAHTDFSHESSIVSPSVNLPQSQISSSLTPITPATSQSTPPRSHSETIPSGLTSKSFPVAKSHPPQESSTDSPIHKPDEVEDLQPTCHAPLSPRAEATKPIVTLQDVTSFQPPSFPAPTAFKQAIPVSPSAAGILSPPTAVLPPPSTGVLPPPLTGVLPPPLTGFLPPPLTGIIPPPPGVLPPQSPGVISPPTGVIPASPFRDSGLTMQNLETASSPVPLVTRPAMNHPMIPPPQMNNAFAPPHSSVSFSLPPVRHVPVIPNEMKSDSFEEPAGLSGHIPAAMLSAASSGMKEPTRFSRIVDEVSMDSGSLSSSSNLASTSEEPSQISASPSPFPTFYSE